MLDLAFESLAFGEQAVGGLERALGHLAGLGRRLGYTGDVGRHFASIRVELQASKETTRSLAEQYGLNPKTVAQWRKRTTTDDAPMGPHVPRSSVLTPAKEAMIVEFRRRRLLPLDDVMGCLMDAMPSVDQRPGRAHEPYHQAFYYEGLESLKAHVLAFVTAYNFAKHLKALRWRTPFQATCDAWAKDPSIFKINPHHLIPGPHI